MATYVSTIGLLADGVCDRGVAFSDLGSLEYQKHHIPKRKLSSGTLDTTNRCPISFPTWGLLKTLAVL